MRRVLVYLVVGIWVLARPIQAKAANLGVHILEPNEIESVISNWPETNSKIYVTVPYSLSDRRRQVWEDFFTKTDEYNIEPLVRLVTNFVDGVWVRPSRKEMVEAADFLGSLANWQGKRVVILFNEPNHASEWGGEVNPRDYARRAMFMASYLHTEPGDFVVLPAGLDAAAPNSRETMDSFRFWTAAFDEEPNLINWINGWTVHGYPNPGFVSSPYGGGKQSLRGFETDLGFLSSYNKADLPIYITETGWKQDKWTIPLLPRYYRYAMEEIWDHPQVQAVTVFLWQGSSGPFADFSLLTPEGTPTPQWEALKEIVK